MATTSVSKPSPAAADDDTTIDDDEDTIHNIDEDELDELAAPTVMYRFGHQAAGHRYQRMLANGERSDNDFYITPPAVAESICDFIFSIVSVIDKRSRIYDPCSGLSHLVKPFKLRGMTVIEGDLIQYSDRITIVENFLTSTFSDYDLCITNPPFCLKHEWLGKLIASNKPFAMLAPLNMMVTVTSSQLISESLDFICPLVGNKTFYNVTKGKFVFVGELCLYIGNIFGGRSRPCIIPFTCHQPTAVEKKNFVAEMNSSP